MARSAGRPTHYARQAIFIYSRIRFYRGSAKIVPFARVPGTSSTRWRDLVDGADAADGASPVPSPAEDLQDEIAGDEVVQTFQHDLELGVSVGIGIA